jgi:ABC-type branched-subunit amino acid transport system permease subunit
MNTLDRAKDPRRLVLFLSIGVVLRIMTGATGTQDDFYYALHKDFVSLALLAWLGIGLVIWALATFWPNIKVYLVRPGGWVLLYGIVSVVIAQSVLFWYEGGKDKFGGLRASVIDNTQVAPIARAYFGWLAWAQLAIVGLLVLASVVTRNKIVGYLAAVVALIAGLIVLDSQHLAISFFKASDHSWGPRIAVLGYVLLIGAALVAVLSSAEKADTQAFVNRIMGWRPGFAVAVAATLLGVYAMGLGSWLLPSARNATLTDVHNIFLGTGLAPIAVQYFIWLGWALLLVSAALALAGSYLRNRILGASALVASAAGLVITMLSIHAITDLAATVPSFGVGGPWQDLGEGAWWTCGAFRILAIVGAIVALSGARAATEAAQTDPSTGTKKWLHAPGAGASAAALVAAVALFFPPTLSPSWWTVFATSIGIFIFLAIGLNVVVGWAGLLDLGFIAFYAIGAYVTAYLVGSLKVHPPIDLRNGWVLLAIPFAVVCCLIAGLVLGFPTLRLRGDYLAIVTLGFGEIIRIVANNADGITNGPRGTEKQVPHPVINLGVHRFAFGLDQLPYWYLLLAAIIVVVVLFRKLEYSRTGRAWAAIREDEVAAQATGINPLKYKLMAFAIGASTSGIAGVLYASNVGFFNPSNFTLQTSILVVAYVVFGGMGSLPGAVAGAAVLTWLPEFLRDQVPPEDKTMYIGAILIAMMIFRPAGLIPAKRRATELTHQGPDSAESQAVPVGGGLGGSYA